MEANLHLGWDDWLIESIWMVLPLLALLLLLLLAERCSLLVGCQDVSLQFFRLGDTQRNHITMQ